MATLRDRPYGNFNFLVDLGEGGLGENERRLVLAAALFIDLQYFEKKAR